MKKHLPLSLLIFVGVCLLGWAGWSWICNLWEKDQAAGRSQVAALATTHPAEWQISPDQRDKLVAAFAGIRIGDRKEDVLTALGKPDVDHEDVIKGPSMRRNGSTAMYRFFHYELKLENVRWDKNVSLHFDNDDRLKSIRSDVPEIVSR